MESMRRQQGFVLLLLVAIIMLVEILVLGVVAFAHKNSELLNMLACHYKIDQTLLDKWQSKKSMTRHTLVPGCVYRLSISIAGCQRHYVMEYWPQQQPHYRTGYFIGSYRGCDCGSSAGLSATRSSKTKQSP